MVTYSRGKYMRKKELDNRFTAGVKTKAKKPHMDKAKAKLLKPEVFSKYGMGINHAIQTGDAVGLCAVVQELERARMMGENVYLCFNGKNLYSVDVTMDNAFKTVFLCSQDEYIQRQKDKDSIETVK